VAAANDRGSDGWVVKRPRDGDNSGGGIVTSGDLFDCVRDGEIAGEVRLMVIFGVAAEVVRREGGDALFGHGSRKKAGVHRGVVDAADVVLLTEREIFRLVGSVDHGVGWLL